MTVLAAEAAAPIAEDVAGGAAGAKLSGEKGPISVGGSKGKKIKGPPDPKSVGKVLADNAQNLPTTSDADQQRRWNQDAQDNPVDGARNKLPQDTQVWGKTKGGTYKSPNKLNPLGSPHAPSGRFAHPQNILKATFFFLLIFLIAREILDGTEGKPNGKQILAIMVIYMVLGFMAGSPRWGKLAAALGVLILIDSMLNTKNSAFLSKIGTYFSGAASTVTQLS